MTITYNGTPDNLLTYTSPSSKLTLQSNGLYSYQAHNLFLNSASPADQSVTVVSGATYAVIITGATTTTLSGAATGTITAGTTNITASTTTLTFGSTSGSGTVHLRRTPSDATYMATAGSARFGLPMEWDVSGNPLGLLVEEARTNLCLWGSDLTNAAWGKTNATTAKTATGPDGVANSATTLTASAANGVAIQNITSASAARSGSVYLKRRTGTGAVTLAIGETTGSELISNGGFGSDTVWSKGANWTIAAGVATKSGGGSNAISQSISITAGKFYKCVVTISGRTAGSLYWRVGDTNSVGIMSTNATFEQIFQCGTVNTTVALFGDAGFDGSIDNVSVLEVAETTVDLSSGNWVRASIENKTITNPCVAIKIATSGDEVDVALAQMETGAFTTSPIETFGASVTRAADNINLATSAFPYSAQGFTLIATVSSFGLNFSGVAALNANGTYSTGSGALLRISGVNLIEAGGNNAAASLVISPVLTANQQIKIGATYDDATNNCSVSARGASPSSMSTLDWVGTSNRLQFGALTSAGVQPLNGHIKTIVYLPRVATNAELQTLTS